MKTLIMTNDESRVLRAFLHELTDENCWLNSKWREGARVHEVSVLHRLARRPFDTVVREVRA
uniref:Uncharacterized protein n=1 Tax=viral metagenome TaxID=1070528 RepID=A0A6M3LA21_9ZZZZ